MFQITCGNELNSIGFSQLGRRLRQVPTEFFQAIFLDSVSQIHEAMRKLGALVSLNKYFIKRSAFSHIKHNKRDNHYVFGTASEMCKTITSINKANVLRYSIIFWDQAFEEVSQEYPHVETASYSVIFQQI
ncbi:hypothetical protein [Sporosarcina sp. P21c]|uniref:hypothetical protein n=1 Tax=Sporosarcina sp. P21c TaxID=2048255 RepID=UPI003517A85D